MPDQPDEPSLAATMRKPPTAAAPSCPIHEPGAVIAERYVVEQRFEGGMGYVYIALDRSQNLRFAIKQPKTWMLAEPTLLARVAREADAWTGLGMHPHIAYCYFVRSLAGVPHIFVEYVDGGNLREWIATGRCIDYRVSLDLAIQCCQGMERAQGWGMVHRDLKPENILVSQDGQAKITDFGLVGDLGIREGAAGDRAGMSTLGTQLGMQMGTPAYMAPEQWRDPRRRSAEAPDGVDCDSDVYSFGVCLWEMVCGRLPYPSALADAELPDPRRSRRDLPASLDQLLRDVVARDRRQRPTDFGVLRKRLNKVYRELFHDDAPVYRIELPDTGAAELNNQGYFYAELDKPEQALACFREAVEKDPTQPQAVYNLALRQWRAAEIDDLEAVQRVENCRNNPTVDPAVVADLVADLHYERGDLDALRAFCNPDYLHLLKFNWTSKYPSCSTLFSPKPIVSVALAKDGRHAVLGSRDYRVATRAPSSCGICAKGVACAR
ncbi:MAG: protein kinase [Candidatus Contendobacter sp.]|nr:protein kinase [Candidatus Contendobacter sp.]